MYMVWLVEPKRQHLEVILQILGYINSTIDYRIFYKKDMPCKITRYCDANYAGDHDTRRLTIEYIFILGLGVLSWCSKRQPIVSLSSMEMEYRAAVMVAQKCIWLMQLL